jgi:hypothetical protein
MGRMVHSRCGLDATECATHFATMNELNALSFDRIDVDTDATLATGWGRRRARS